LNTSFPFSEQKTGKGMQAAGKHDSPESSANPQLYTGLEFPLCRGTVSVNGCSEISLTH